MNKPINKQAIYLMFGYIGSGKSTFAKQLAVELGAVRLNGDELRTKMFDSVAEIRNQSNNPLVFAALDYATEQIIKAGKSVVFDVSHNQITDRIGKEQLARSVDANIILIWIKSPLEIARQRTVDRSKRGETISIPIDRYDAMVKGMQEPLPHENCVVINGQDDFESQFVEFKRQMALIA